MPEWKYRKIDLSALPRNTSEVDLLNIVGDEGWELVMVTLNNIAYFKRQIRKRLPKHKT